MANKKELVNRMAEKVGSTKKLAEQNIDALFEVMKETLANGEDIKLVGVFNLSVKNVEPHIGRNPKTGEEIQIPASKKITFKASKTWKNAVNGVVDEE